MGADVRRNLLHRLRMEAHICWLGGGRKARPGTRLRARGPCGSRELPFRLSGTTIPTHIWCVPAKPTSRFVLQADAPDSSKIPSADMTGVTVLLLTCAYRDKFELALRVVPASHSLSEFEFRVPCAPALMSYQT
eukprot:1191745-Prorocentrum_minimum.AAC.4